MEGRECLFSDDEILYIVVLFWVVAFMADLVCCVVMFPWAPWNSLYLREFSVKFGDHFLV